MRRSLLAPRYGAEPTELMVKRKVDIKNIEVKSCFRL